MHNKYLWYIWAAPIGKRPKTYGLRKLENIKKLSKIQGMIA